MVRNKQILTFTAQPPLPLFGEKKALASDMHTISKLNSTLRAGAATVDITPQGSVFLYGYPHVRRYSTGVHDALECTALYLRNDVGQALFLANDLIWVTKLLATEIRGRIRASTGVPEEAIMLTATHTHSGPIMSVHLSNSADQILPKADPAYLALFADRVVAAAVAAVRAAEPAEIGLALARAEEAGTNRHDPAGPTDPEVPVLVARSLTTAKPLACVVVYGMHPTVLHEDSTLISADFPYFTRRFLQQHAFSSPCSVLYLNGAAGNQSPRHLTRANNFAEAQRLGENLGRSLARVVPTIAFRREASIRVCRRDVEVEPRRFPSPGEAEQALQRAKTRHECLRNEGAPRQLVRTAECDLFGAEETVELARAARDGRLESAIHSSCPAEIQVIAIGPWRFVAWPGEIFVEYGLELKRRAPNTFLVTLANGELQGYIVTEEAASRGVYEASNAVFAPVNGTRFVEATLALLNPNH
jgi:neutral ceramidase